MLREPREYSSILSSDSHYHSKEDLGTQQIQIESILARNNSQPVEVEKVANIPTRQVEKVAKVPSINKGNFVPKAK